MDRLLKMVRTPPNWKKRLALVGAGGAAAVGMLSAVIVVLGAEPRGTSDAADPGRVKGCLITVKEEAEVPAKEPGVLMNFKTIVQRNGQPVEQEIEEGVQVSKDSVLAQIDDRQARMAWEVAKRKLEAAQKEAGNNVNVRYAMAANRVSEAEYQQAVDTNLRAAQAIPLAEVRRLKLKCAETSLQIEQAEHELGINGIKVRVQEAEADSAAEDVKRREIRAPLDGIVVKLYRHEGEWVKPGDSVVRIVRMDRLRIEGFLDASRVSPRDVDGQPVSVVIALPYRGDVIFPGKIVFVSPIVEAGPQFLVRAEVLNRQEDGQWLLRPGLNAEMNIQLKK